MREEPAWPCERTLTGHAYIVESLAGWEGKLISGSYDNAICVWELETGGLDATLTGHTGAVHGLLVHGERLFSASEDGSIRAWALGTWAAVASVAHGWGSWPACLAASGPKLFSGSESSSDPCEAADAARGEVRVWDAESLACEHAVRLPAGAGVGCLAAAGGEVWGGVGVEVVVWGRE